MARLALLVGAAAFWAKAANDMARAQRRLLVQAMTFEGDAAGLEVAAAIAASRAADRRVLVDDYSRWTLSDRSLFNPLWRFDRHLRWEARATAEMFAGLAAGGAGVRRTNTIGPLAWNWPARNHKKLIVADDVAWIGGINFSDHNFAWDDLMLRIADSSAADWLAADFEGSFAAGPRAGSRTFPGLTVLSLDGRSNQTGFAPVIQAIARARATITAVSPYLTFPFTEHLAAAQRREVQVRLITPAASNKPIVGAYLAAFARRAGFDLRLTPRMLHFKALLIDGERLILGSSNFDFVSLAAEEELLAIVEDAGVIADFQKLVIDPALAASGSNGRSHRGGWPGWLAEAVLRLAAVYAGVARHAPRGSTEGFG